MEIEKMKKNYIQPVAEVLLFRFTDHQMNTGSVYDGNGDKVSGLGEGEGGGTPGDDDIVWGDARGFSLWEDSEEDSYQY